MSLFVLLFLEAVPFLQAWLFSRVKCELKRTDQPVQTDLSEKLAEEPAVEATAVEASAEEPAAEAPVLEKSAAEVPAEDR